MISDQERDALIASRPERRVTAEQIAKKVVLTDFSHPTGTVTICTLTLDNGYSVIGHSACVHSGDYNEEKGRKLAYDDAFDKIWRLEGYLLKEILHLEKQRQSADVAQAPADAAIGETRAEGEAQAEGEARAA